MKSFKKIFNHKYSFFFIVFLTVLQLLIFIKDKSYQCLLIFIASCFLSNYFTKNISIAFLSALIISNFVFGCKKVTEGMDTSQIKDVMNIIKSGKVDTQNMDNLKNMANQYSNLKKKSGPDMDLNMGALNELLKFNSKISSSNLTSKDDVNSAVKHLRANKQLLKNMIDKF